MSTKLAINLQPGDRIEGYKFPASLYAGTVKNTVVVDNGVQINLKPSGHYTVPEEQEIEVVEQPLSEQC